MVDLPQQILNRQGEIQHRIKALVRELEQLEARAAIGVPAEQVRKAQPLVEHVYFAHETDHDRKMQLLSGKTSFIKRKPTVARESFIFRSATPNSAKN